MDERVDSSRQTAVRAVVDRFARAVRSRDVEAMVALCSADVLVFDLLPPLTHQGRDAVRGLWSRAFAPYVAPLEYELFRVDVALDGNVAYAHAVTRLAAARADGERFAGWLRLTFGFRREAEAWKIAHQHVSVPFDLDSGAALLDLEP